ncbi:RNA polymerase sigma-70 factor, ECF subfamily [Sinomicrobium oceani]|uniref:RNA polymerase sigma-70 factor, ECF subfamily n=1 Tax=Sinomicrobium oceani TaxID=1150368 RepID=A0A1K1RSJ2_9FLAO|nr:sigma-70 family RNA polymerase sigma factor [Sinomicrobium oceani]SFW75054.1 RNA polymerase sigma-70 factor, ECF subfamily [Sinomicrobium oceani]
MIKDSLRPLLETYAYNILGSYEDARDVVQDVWLKQLEHPVDGVANVKAYLIRSVINHAINVRKRQDKFRKEYPGHWLPEPIATDRADIFLERTEILSYALMILLEKLTPRERAVFILKEGYNYTHSEIAETLEITVDNSRQLFSRGKGRLGREMNPSKDGRGHEEGLFTLLNVIKAGEMSSLESLLHDDVHATSDGGGKVSAAVNMVKGKTDVSRLLMGIFRKFYMNTPGMHFEIERVNHYPAVFCYIGEELISCMPVDIREGKIRNVYFVRNPDKLKNLHKNR